MHWMDILLTTHYHTIYHTTTGGLLWDTYPLVSHLRMDGMYIQLACTVPVAVHLSTSFISLQAVTVIRITGPLTSYAMRTCVQYALL